MADTHIATTRSKSVLGTMNDYKFQIEAMIHESGGISLLEMSINLSKIPVGPLKYRFPGEVALDLLKNNHPQAKASRIAHLRSRDGLTQPAAIPDASPLLGCHRDIDLIRQIYRPIRLVQPTADRRRSLDNPVGDRKRFGPIGR